jgi:hypothetical protein
LDQRQSVSTQHPASVLFLIMKSVFRLAARRPGLSAGALLLGSAPVSEKRVGLSRGPHRRLWAFNGPRWYRSAPLRGVAAGRLGAFATATRPAICQLGLDLTDWAGRWDRNGARGPSVRTPMPRTVRLHAVATSIRAHDVFGTSTQLSGRATHPITTMMPVWQCGHSRNDCPVSA